MYMILPADGAMHNLETSFCNLYQEWKLLKVLVDDRGCFYPFLADWLFFETHAANSFSEI